MIYDPAKHHRRSIRLKGYDYANPGWYYLTICTHDREFLFGEIVRDQMHPSEMGAIAQECWNEIPRHFPRASLDVSVVMPNHLHGIIVIGEVGARHSVPVQLGHGVPVQFNRPVPVQNLHGAPVARPGAGVPAGAARFGKPVPGSLASIVALFKQAVTRRVRARPGVPVQNAHGGSPQNSGGGPIEVWHENYYEHVIRNEKELDRIREYICSNPERWLYDVENPACEREAADDIEEIIDDDP